MASFASVASAVADAFASERMACARVFAGALLTTPLAVSAQGTRMLALVPREPVALAHSRLCLARLPVHTLALARTVHAPSSQRALLIAQHTLH